MNMSMEFSRKLALAYTAVCKPMCQTLKMRQTAFDIVVFVANTPACQIAAEIVEVRKIKANLVSVNVDKLVRDGYLTRESMPGDRRKTRLLCTEKAQPVIMQGRQLQSAFLQRLFAHTDQQMQDAFLKTISIMDKNLNELLEGDIAE